MKNSFIMVLFIVLGGCFNKDSEKEKLNKKNPVGSYGENLSKEPTYNIEQLLSSVDNYLNKNVLISGIISEVCPMRGCWLEIEDEKTKKKIRIKVTDGEIVFPLSAKGKNVIAEGVFTRLELSTKQAKNWKHHLALEKGVILDTANIILATSDYYEYRINSNAAKIF